jgi:hypothetical protein
LIDVILRAQTYVHWPFRHCARNQKSCALHCAGHAHPRGAIHGFYWAPFLLLGLEHARIAARVTRVCPIDFYDYPISHSLLSSVGCDLGRYLSRASADSEECVGDRRRAAQSLDIRFHRAPSRPGVTSRGANPGRLGIVELFAGNRLRGSSIFWGRAVDLPQLHACP